jgi:hypothetical protein
MSKVLSTTQDLYLGCDPEFFFRKDGEVIGSESVIPDSGFSTDYGKIIQDGVQAEINVVANLCRQRLARNIGYSLVQLGKYLKRKHPNVTTDFGAVVEVKEAEMMRLSEKSKTFGCAESFNAHLPKINKISKIPVDPHKYFKRSAGGHLHLGKYVFQKYPEENGHVMFDRPTIRTSRNEKTLKDTDKLVPLLDIIVGNTCVLLDRDDENVERRKVYGRAGEYRTPDHGLEYRTLSNFWLKSPHLMSLVTGLARQAVQIGVEDTDSTMYDSIMSLVNMNDIETAINTNDFDLARKNFDKVIGYINSITPFNNGFYPLRSDNLEKFNKFVKYGIYKAFPNNPMDTWYDAIERSTYGQGFSNYLYELAI